MPFVTVKWFPRSKELMAETAKEITDVIVKVTGVGADHVYVFFEDLPRDHMGHAGELASERKS